MMSRKSFNVATNFRRLEEAIEAILDDMNINMILL